MSMQIGILLWAMKIMDENVKLREKSQREDMSLSERHQIARVVRILRGMLTVIYSLVFFGFCSFIPIIFHYFDIIDWQTTIGYYYLLDDYHCHCLNLLLPMEADPSLTEDDRLLLTESVQLSDDDEDPLSVKDDESLSVNNDDDDEEPVSEVESELPMESVQLSLDDDFELIL
uniref:Uncharacterized protein n=1 Tax=Panagrolaimus sp. JU765 TaxID=591449 RepID=A0AC34RPK0_9BILA